MYDTDLGYTSEAAEVVEVGSDINDRGRVDRPRSEQTGAREDARVGWILSVSWLTIEEGEVRHDGELTDSGRVDNDDFRLLCIDGCGKAMTDELDRRVKLWRREKGEMEEKSLTQADGWE
jgi:hypothetical protein